MAVIIAGAVIAAGTAWAGYESAKANKEASKHEVDAQKTVALDQMKNDLKMARLDSTTQLAAKHMEVFQAERESRREFKIELAKLGLERDKLDFERDKFSKEHMLAVDKTNKQFKLDFGDLRLRSTTEAHQHEEEMKRLNKHNTMDDWFGYA